MHSIFWYDTIEEFNVNLKANCDQLNLAHETKIKKSFTKYQLELHWLDSDTSFV